MKVLVPLDGSPLSESIIGYVQRLVSHDVELLLLHVVPPRPMPLSGVAAPGAYAEEKARAEDAERAGPYVEALARRLHAEGWAARTRMESGHAAEVILRTAAETGVDLIAMSTHGRTGLARLVMGSHTGHMLRQQIAPMMIVRPDGLHQTWDAASEEVTDG